MPFYEYECENCKFYTELLQKVSDAPLRKCPSCGKNAMKKLVSAPVFRLKGAGWYETDFKGDKENKRNLAVEKEPEASSEDKSKAAATSTDAKADAKPAETKAAEPASSGKESSGKSSSGGARKSVLPSRTAAASKSRAKPPARTAAKSKAKPAARRKGR
jgi:putative FmdB family regulatory protein